MEIKEIIKEDVEFMQDKLNSMLKELNKNKKTTDTNYLLEKIDKIESTLRVIKNLRLKVLISEQK